MSRRTALYSPPCHPCGPDPQPVPVALIQLDDAAKPSFERRHARLPRKGLAFALVFLFDRLRCRVANRQPVEQANTIDFTASALASAGIAR